MKPTVIFRKDTKNVKKTAYLKNGVFLIYAPRKIKISPMQFEKYDTEITVILPKKYHRYFTSKFKTDEIALVIGERERIWIGILNRSLTETVIIKKTSHLDFSS